MKRYLPGAALAAVVVGGIYAVLLIAASAAPAPSASDQRSQSSVVADRLRADAALLAHPGAPPRPEAAAP